jgi:hypothetical protein
MTTVVKYSNGDSDPKELWWTNADYNNRRVLDKSLAMVDDEVRDYLDLLSKVYKDFTATDFSHDESFQVCLERVKKGFAAGHRGMEHWLLRPSKQREEIIQGVVWFSQHSNSTKKLAAFAGKSSSAAERWAQLVAQVDAEIAQLTRNDEEII